MVYRRNQSMAEATDLFITLLEQLGVRRQLGVLFKMHFCCVSSSAQVVLMKSRWGV